MTLAAAAAAADDRLDQRCFLMIPGIDLFLSQQTTHDALLLFALVVQVACALYCWAPVVKAVGEVHAHRNFTCWLVGGLGCWAVSFSLEG